MRPDAWSRRSRMTSPQLPCIFESPFRARVRLLASSLRRLFSSTRSLMRSPSEKRSLASVLYTCSTFSRKSLRFSPKGRSRLPMCSALSRLKSSALFWKMRLDSASNSVFMRRCSASASSRCSARRFSSCCRCSASRSANCCSRLLFCSLNNLSCSARRLAKRRSCSASRSPNCFSCAASRSVLCCPMAFNRSSATAFSRSMRSLVVRFSKSSRCCAASSCAFSAVDLRPATNIPIPVPTPSPIISNTISMMYNIMSVC